MRKRIQTIVLGLFFIVLLSPVKVNATEPSFLYPIGIVIQVDACDESSVEFDQYIIDIVVKREDFSGELLEDPRTYPIIPSALLTSEYADPENEWISIILLERDDVWHNETCKSLFYEYAYDENDFPFTEYKVVVYEQGEDPVESEVYYARNSATWSDPEGFMVVYESIYESFSLHGYEAQMSGGYNPGFFNSLGFVIGIFITVIAFVFVLLESLIYLIARQGLKAVLIPLGFNLIAILYAFSQFFAIFRLSETLYGIFGIILILNLYVGKILLLRKYAKPVYQISVLFSVIYFVIYFFFFLASVM